MMKLDDIEELQNKTRQMILDNMIENGDNPDLILHFAQGKEDGFKERYADSRDDYDIDDSEDYAFLLYTPHWIYFSVCHDCIAWVDSIPRYPENRYIPKFFGG